MSIRKHKSRNLLADSALFESLEQRDFLTADLTGGFASLGPVTYAAGSTPVVDFFLKNSGDTKAAAGVVNFFARPVDAVDASDDIAIGVGKAKGTVAPGAQSPTFHFKLNVPVNAAPGEFTIVGIVDVGNKVAEGEAGEANNTAIGGPLTIAAPDFNLTSSINDVKFTTSILEGTGAGGTLRINVNVSGNAPVPKTAKVQVQLWIKDDQGVDTLLTTLSNQALAGLTSGKPKGFNVKFNIAPSLAAGTYQFFAVVDPLSEQSPVTGTVTESNDTLADNRSALSDFSFTVAPAFTDLSISGSTTVGASASNTSTPTATVTITNAGNTDVDGTADIKFFATTNGTITGDSVEVGSLDDQSIKIKGGAVSKSFKANLNFSGLNVGSYIIVARIDAGSGITDSNAANNAASISSAFNITLAPGVLGDAGDIVTLTTTSSGSNQAGYSEAGSFITNRGVTGIYTYSKTNAFGPVPSIATFSMTTVGGLGGQSIIAARFTKNAPANLTNKTLTFSNNAGSVSWTGAVLFYGVDQRDGKLNVA